MDYLTVLSCGKSEYIEKKSIFIGNVKRVKSEEQCKSFLDSIVMQHKEAKHHVYAYVIHGNVSIMKYSDDKEPQGTAGLPILNLIKSYNLEDIIIVVTRYFGGTLLGTGGLTRAYSKASKDAIEDSLIGSRIEGFSLSISLPYEYNGKFSYYLKNENIFIKEQNYLEQIEYTLYIEKHNKDKIYNDIINMVSGEKIYMNFEEKNFLKGKDIFIEDN